MLYELKAILWEIEKIDKRLNKDAFTHEEIQEKINYISDFLELQNEIHNDISSLEQADINDIDAILRILYNLDATLGMCVNRIGTVQDAIIHVISHFSEDELEGAG